MDKETFNKVTSNPYSAMVFHMDNWLKTETMANNKENFILIDTMRKYIHALASGDKPLADSCIEKFKELSDLFIEN